MFTLADATNQDIVDAVNNLYTSVTDNTAAVFLVAEMVYTINEFSKSMAAYASVVAFFVCFAVGWVIYSRLRAGRLFR